MPDNQRFRFTDEQRHQAALDYLRTRSLDAESEESHIHIHLDRPDYLPPSTTSANPPGKTSGSPIEISDQEDPDEEYVEPDEEGEEGERVVGELPFPARGHDLRHSRERGRHVQRGTRPR